MKKSELKKMIKEAWLEETTLNLFEQDGKEIMVDSNMLKSYIDKMISLADDMEYTPKMVKGLQDLKAKLSDGKMSVEDALSKMEETIKITGDEIDAVEALGQAVDYDDAIVNKAREIRGLNEEEEKIKVEDEVETDEEPAGEEDMEMAPPAEVGISGDAKQVQDNLEAALIAAKELGDQKLIDQIGNSITFFTRTHVVGKEDVAEGGEVDMNVNIDENIEESYEKNKWLRIAGIKK